MTTGFEIALDDDDAELLEPLDEILFPDFTDLMGLIFMLTPSSGAGLFFSDAGTCFKLALVGGLPEDTGLNVPLDCLSMDGAEVLFGGGVGKDEDLEGNGMSSFFPSSEFKAEAGMVPKLLRFVEPWRVSE